VFQVFRRRVVNDRRRIGAARREWGEKEASHDARASASYRHVISLSSFWRLEPDALSVV
jgi:hypothetical protein